MTKQELYDDVWQSLPARKHLLGRQRVDAIVARTLADFPIAVLAQCDARQAEVVGKHYARTVERRERQYGIGFVASVILAAIISEIVRRLISRWIDNRKTVMEAML